MSCVISRHHRYNWCCREHKVYFDGGSWCCGWKSQPARCPVGDEVERARAELDKLRQALAEGRLIVECPICLVGMDDQDHDVDCPARILER